MRCNMFSLQDVWTLVNRPKRSKQDERRLEKLVLAKQCTWIDEHGNECKQCTAGGSFGLCKKHSNAVNYQQKTIKEKDGIEDAVRWLQRAQKRGLMCSPHELCEIKRAAKWGHVA